MDTQSMKDLITRKLGRLQLTAEKYAPEILLGVGLVGIVATVVMASKATLNAKNILDDHNEKMDTIDAAMNEANGGPQYTHEDEVKTKAIVYIQTGLAFSKLYGPTVGVGVLSIASILASHGIMKRREVGLIAAYNLLKEVHDNYRKRMQEQLGEDIEKDFHLGTQDETRTVTATDEEGKKTKIKETTKGMYNNDSPAALYSRFFDESNPNYKDDRLLNKAFLLGQQRYANDILRIRGHLYLNEVYESLGFPHTVEGAVVGWVVKDPDVMKAEGRDGYVDFGIFDVFNDPGREFVNLTNPTILLNFNVDGLMFDKI